ncbi:MAG: PKD domain-containing protein [Candidatus Thermoplasmatota archaeon]
MKNMKRRIPILVVGMLLCTVFGVVGFPNDTAITYETNTEKMDFTHTIFAEYGTATWCGYCKYAHGALKEIYAEGQYPFYYVSLVTDKNTKASQRCITDYNAYGWPTVWFDGGYRVDVGAGSIPSAKTTYINSINSCGNRVVEDVDVDVVVTWLGGTNMEIGATVINNEASTYGGRIRVYITEIVSSMGWYDTAGQLYTYAFLDFAFNEVLSITPGGSWSDTVTWDGSSHGFPSITESNIMVIAAVFNDEAHTGYSYPPSSNPFTAYYVDDAAAATPGSSNNHAPNKPNPPAGPTSGVTNVDYTYSGSTIDPDGDAIYYLFSWGDGSDSGWLGPYASGTQIESSHRWALGGTYSVTVKAKDENLEGPWSDPLTVQMSGPSIGLDKVNGGLFRVSAEIINPGETPLSDVNWEITLQGGAFIGKETSGQGLTIAANSNVTIQSGLILGFGATSIKVKAWVPEGPFATVQRSGSVFLFIIKVIG